MWCTTLTVRRFLPTANDTLSFIYAFYALSSQYIYVTVSANENIVFNTNAYTSELFWNIQAVGRYVNAYDEYKCESLMTNM